MNNNASINLFAKEERENFIERLKIDLISRYFPFTKEQILYYRSMLNFDRNHLMNNDLIEWDIELLDQLDDQLDWTAIWKLNNITLDIDFFKKYESQIDFDSIHLSRNIAWSNDLLNDYGDRFNWSRCWRIPVAVASIENLRRLKDKLDWDIISERINIDFTDGVLKEFSDKWNWEKLSTNKNLPLSIEFIRKYIDKVDFNALSQNPKCLKLIYKTPGSSRWNWGKIISNSGITYNKESFEFIFSHFKKEYHNGRHLTVIRGKTALNTFLAEVLFWHHNDLSYFFAEEFIDHFPEKYWCRSWKTKLSFELIEKYKDKLDFDRIGFLEMHADVITREFIEENINLFNLKSYSFYSSLPLTIELISKFEDKISKIYLAHCIKLDWTWDYIVEKFDKTNSYALSKNKGIYDRLIKNNLSEEEILEFLDSALSKGYRNDKYQVLF